MHLDDLLNKRTQLGLININKNFNNSDYSRYLKYGDISNMESLWNKITHHRDLLWIIRSLDNNFVADFLWNSFQQYEGIKLSKSEPISEEVTKQFVNYIKCCYNPFVYLR